MVSIGAAEEEAEAEEADDGGAFAGRGAGSMREALGGRRRLSMGRGEGGMLGPPPDEPFRGAVPLALALAAAIDETATGCGPGAGAGACAGTCTPANTDRPAPMTGARCMPVPIPTLAVPAGWELGWE